MLPPLREIQSPTKEFSSPTPAMIHRARRFRGCRVRGSVLQFDKVDKPSSTGSVLILWVEAFESNAGISGGKLPVHTGLFRIAFVLPRLGFLA